MTATLAVIAKAPIPGLSKTRLCPPLTPEQAAGVAAAALADTLAAVAGASAGRRVLVLDGAPGPWMPTGTWLEVIPQRGGGLDERLANAFADIGGPAFVIGMDTPQIRPETLSHAVERLSASPAILGPALDGGYWGIGLRVPDRRALVGVPMSTADTCAAQLTRLRELGLDVDELEALRDIDTYEDALAVARLAPDTRVAAELAAMLRPGVPA